MSQHLKLVLDETTDFGNGKRIPRIPFRGSGTLAENSNWSRLSGEFVTELGHVEKCKRIDAKPLPRINLINNKFLAAAGFLVQSMRPVLSEADKFQQERNVFLQKKEQLLKSRRYGGKFVAMRNGRIVGYDDNIGELAKRVYRKFGYSPIYMGKVEIEEQPLDLPSREE